MKAKEELNYIMGKRNAFFSDIRIPEPALSWKAMQMNKTKTLIVVYGLPITGMPPRL